MLNFCCVKTGTKYGPEYVNILFDMVRRNLTAGTPGRFICFTDDPTGLSDGIEIHILPPDLKGWWGKLYLFSKEAFPVDDRVIYLDLDVVITGELDPLLEYQGDFIMLEDRGDPSLLNSGVMAWKVGEFYPIWEGWLKEGRPNLAGGDQVWIQKCLNEKIGKTPDTFQGIYPGKFFSYKLECFDKSIPPPGSMVVYFHGEPRPHNCGNEWVQNVWKIGGGTAEDLKMICNLAIDKVKQNISSACERDVPWLSEQPVHKCHAVIVGGAPSIKKYIEDIRARQKEGQQIFATNNVVNFLLENGINPDYQVIVDAREENERFIKQEGPKNGIYLASQCHPKLWDKATEFGHQITLWHCFAPELEEAIKNPEKKPECLVACGSTVGLNAMGIAYALGYRILHIYGMDSSYTDGVHHAYEQTSNDGEIILDAKCHGRDFKASPWMLHQANQFQELSRALIEGGATIVVHGTGLIPWIAMNYQAEEAPDTEIVEHNGIWWPSKDKETRPAMELWKAHRYRLLDNLEGSEVAVQAGGNVGIVPLELANHFDRVITFEPHPLNFRCLEKNIAESPKIEAHNKALSNVTGKCGMAGLPRNCGAGFITDGDLVETTTIDSLELEACDLIQLDVEGSEMNILLGAEKTIRKFKPVLCIAYEGLGERYGHSDKMVGEWLNALGYKEKERMLRDVIFTNLEREQICSIKQQLQDSAAQ